MLIVKICLAVLEAVVESKCYWKSVPELLILKLCDVVSSG